MIQEEETYFQCPWCFETISMLLDPSISEQSYIEDCEVCCRPIRIFYRTTQGQVSDVTADRA